MRYIMCNLVNVDEWDAREFSWSDLMKRVSTFSFYLVIWIELFFVALFGIFTRCMSAWSRTSDPKLINENRFAFFIKVKCTDALPIHDHDELILIYFDRMGSLVSVTRAELTASATAVAPTVAEDLTLPTEWSNASIESYESDIFTPSSQASTQYPVTATDVATNRYGHGTVSYV